jgi:hypothetical protein
MAWAVEMFFDEQADAAVRELWTELAEAGLPSLATLTHRRHRPHVSLFVADSLYQADLTGLRAVLASRHPVLRLSALATFPGQEGVLFLGVTVTEELLALQAGAYQAVAGQPVGYWPLYRPGYWVPHCTLAFGLAPEQIAAAIEVLHGFQPVEAVVTAAGMTSNVTGAVTALTQS